MATYMANASTVSPKWYVIDAKGRTLGRLATQIAVLLRGKHKPEFTPHVDTGDFIVVINAEQISVTGKKVTDKWYHRHSGYPGGIRSETFAEVREKQPTRMIQLAVKGMLPKGPLGRQIYSKLKVYAGATHPHQAQQPQSLDQPREGE
jgi:large subunit ribosomal protein L13